MTALLPAHVGTGGRSPFVPVLAVLLAVLPLAWLEGTALRTWMLLAFSPLVEEIAFREGLQRWLQGRTTPHRAVLCTALAFGAAHAAASPAWLAAAVILPALAIGAAYARSGSLALAVGLHASCNAVWLLLAPLLSSHGALQLLRLPINA